MNSKPTWLIGILLACTTLIITFSPINPFEIRKDVTANRGMIASIAENINITAWQNQIFDLKSYYRLHPPMPEHIKKQIMELERMIEQARQRQRKG